MRARSVILLVRFLLQFFTRRVLGRGVLAQRPVRWLLGGGVVAAYAGYCLLSIVVLREFLDGSDLTGVLLEMAGLSTVFWVVAVYTVLRVLFLKSDELLQLTYTLPATNRERVLAFVVFEALIIGLASLGAVGAICLAALVLAGPAALEPIGFGVACPALLTYLLVSSSYHLVERALLAIGHARLRGIVVPILLAVAMAGLFQAVNAQTVGYAAAYLEGRAYAAPQLAFLRLDQAAGPIVAAGATLLTVAIMTFTVIVTAPRDYAPVKKFFRLMPAAWAASRFGAHVLVLVRSFETLFVLLIVLAVTALVALNDLQMPPFQLVLLTFQGIYAFATAEPLRRIGTLRPAPASHYTHLVTAQVAVLAVVAVPVVAVSVLQGIEAGAILPVLGFSLVNVVVSTLLGIVFPPEKGNPFSVVVGLVLMIVVVMTLALGINIFSLPAILNAGIVIGLTALAAYFGVLGIARMDSPVLPSTPLERINP